MGQPRVDKNCISPCYKFICEPSGTETMSFLWAFSENTISLLPCMGKFAILMISYFLSVQE